MMLEDYPPPTASSPNSADICSSICFLISSTDNSLSFSSFIFREYFLSVSSMYCVLYHSLVNSSTIIDLTQQNPKIIRQHKNNELINKILKIDLY